LIAIDWGTSSMRAFLLDKGGAVLEERRSACGILEAGGQFASALGTAIDGWDDPLIVMAGMIGSRQGWIEVPYVDCPAGPREIVTALHRVPPAEFDGRDLWIVPGLRAADPQGGCDVMRGEETQICGVIDELGLQRHTVCLPGTHSKRASVMVGRVEAFATAMTGEIFELLCVHSMLGRLMSPARDSDSDAFALGVTHAKRDGDLLHHLFAVRTLGLFDALSPEQLRSFLSGLLIGHELNDLPADSGTVHLIAAPALLSAYEVALRLRGHATRAHAEVAAAHGCYRLASLAGLHPQEPI
jgi:2-dehydro-3-deoxygalactonokinase